IIWTSPLIPSDPLVWRKDLDARLKEKIADFVFSYGSKDANEMKVLAGLQWAPFKRSSNDQLLPIRQMEVSKALAKLRADASIPDADKKEKIAGLEKEFADLGRRVEAIKK